MGMLYYMFVAMCALAALFGVGAAIVLWYDRTKLNHSFVLAIILILAFLAIMVMACLGDLVRGMLI